MSGGYTNESSMLLVCNWCLLNFIFSDCSGSGSLFFFFFKILKNIQYFNKDTHLFWMFENVKNMPRFMKAQISLYECTSILYQDGSAGILNYIIISDLQHLTEQWTVIYESPEDNNQHWVMQPLLIQIIYFTASWESSPLWLMPNTFLPKVGHAASGVTFQVSLFLL